MGKIPRKQLVIEQLKAVCMPYPCTYAELHCISASECQVAGCLPVTSEAGALPTTNQWGWTIEGNILSFDWQETFTGYVTRVLEREWTNPTMQENARRRFDWNVICGQWEHLIETGEFITSDDLVPV